MTKLITNTDEVYCMVSVPANYGYGFISSTGKSFVYRVKGLYTDNKGQTQGKEGFYSTYLRVTLPFRSISPTRSLSLSDAVDFDFDGIISKAFKIR